MLNCYNFTVPLYATEPEPSLVFLQYRQPLYPLSLQSDDDGNEAPAAEYWVARRVNSSQNSIQEQYYSQLQKHTAVQSR